MRVGVMGAGAIGCYVGGRLLASGTDTVLVVRPKLAEELAQHGLHLTDLNGAAIDVPPSTVASSTATSAQELASCDVVIVTVKGGDTAAAGAELAAAFARPRAGAGSGSGTGTGTGTGTIGEASAGTRGSPVVVSLQNGVNNPVILREVLGPQTRVLAGMVPFNVVRKGEGRFHQGTDGALAFEPGAPALVAALEKAGLPAAERADIERVQWGKLVVNLNNVVNALAGVPIKDMLLDAGYRRVMTAMLDEAVDVIGAAGIKPRLDPPLPPSLVPRLLSLPTWLFRLAARPMVRVDPQARSSMWDDLERGRTTEIDALNGEVVKLAKKLGRSAPVNERLVALVKEAEAKGTKSPKLSSAALWSAVKS